MTYKITNVQSFQLDNLTLYCLDKQVWMKNNHRIAIIASITFTITILLVFVTDERSYLSNNQRSSPYNSQDDDLKDIKVTQYLPLNVFSLLSECR